MFIIIISNLSKPHVIGGLSTNIARLCQAGEQFSKSIRMNIVQGGSGEQATISKPPIYSHTIQKNIFSLTVFVYINHKS